VATLEYDEDGRLLFTEEMRREYTILAPQMAPYHFDYLIQALNSEGYNAELLKSEDYSLIHEGMKYVHNDMCIPAMLVIGQFIDALKRGDYDPDKVALILVQTGGGCRASNYIKILRKALEKARLSQVPVISLNPRGFEKNPGFKITPRLLHKLHDAMLFGDTMMNLTLQTRPYEKEAGATKRAKEEIDARLADYFEHRRIFTWRRAKRMVHFIIERFRAIDTHPRNKPKVGIVGEIYVKYSPLGNNSLEETLEKEGVEVVTPPLYDFFLYTSTNRIIDISRYGGSRLEKWLWWFIIWYVEIRRGKIRKAMREAGFEAPIPFKQLKKLVDGVLDKGAHAGEGWLLTAEMIDLIEHGAPNIVSTQPFGCLPNHIVAKGMFKKLKSLYPESNVVAIDYDTSASKINQINRINLMVSNAFRNHARGGEQT